MYEKEFIEVFCTHKWGNSANSGKDYKRPYSKTKRNKKEDVKGKNKQ